MLLYGKNYTAVSVGSGKSLSSLKIYFKIINALGARACPHLKILFFEDTYFIFVLFYVYSSYFFLFVLFYRIRLILLVLLHKIRFYYIKYYIILI